VRKFTFAAVSESNVVGVLRYSVYIVVYAEDEERARCVLTDLETLGYIKIDG